MSGHHDLAGGGQHAGDELFRDVRAADATAPPSDTDRARSAVKPSWAPFQQADEGDRAEQQQAVLAQDEDAMRSLRFPFEADPADALDQLRSVPLDDEDR